DAPKPEEYNYGDGTIFTAQWPENEFTKQVPKPDFDVAFGGTSDSEFSVLCANASVDALRDYTKQLKKKGFDKNAETTDESVFGMTTYSYSAENGKGYAVEVASALGMNVITIKKVG
ncbi:MAG: hypothetical protein LBQ33_02640, partial [Oscillospiraceae bacterium]|nr:hypothetical protein [Oscillospiraceae bacterium]